MTKHRALALAIAALTVAGCAQDPKQVRITEQNKDKFLEEIKDLEGLTVEEAGILYAYTMRSTMAEAVGQSPPSPVGMTVGELIEKQRKIQEEEKKEKEEHDRLAAEATAKADAKAAELRKAVALTVYDKDFVDGDYEDYIVIRCAFENGSGKDIRAFKGQVQFTDLFGQEIFSSNLTISEPTASGEKGTWEGTVDYNQFMDDHQALRNAELKDMKIIWKPAEILFADGSSLNAER